LNDILLCKYIEYDIAGFDIPLLNLPINSIIIVNEIPIIKGFVVIITTKTNKKVPKYSYTNGRTVFIYIFPDIFILNYE